MKSIHTPGVTGYIAGGLGNQLFILAAAWEQSRRLNCPLYLNTSYLKLSGLRDLELSQIDHPGVVLDRPAWTSLKFPGNHIYPVPTVKAFREKVFLEKNQAQFDSRISSIKPRTTIVGYFQSPQYFPHVSKDLLSLISQAPLDKHEQEYLEELSKTPAVTLHLRRGDYQGTGTVIATTGYAQRAIKLVRQLGIQLPIRVFTDSPEVIATQLDDLQEDITLVDNKRLATGLGTIRAMALGEAIITSNSSFSWWGAWLADKTSPVPPVIICPRPWNETGTARADMLLKNWITLDARD